MTLCLYHYLIVFKQYFYIQTDFLLQTISQACSLVSAALSGQSASCLSAKSEAGPGRLTDHHEEGRGVVSKGIASYSFASQCVVLNLIALNTKS